MPMSGERWAVEIPRFPHTHPFVSELGAGKWVNIASPAAPVTSQLPSIRPSLLGRCMRPSNFPREASKVVKVPVDVLPVSILLP